MLAIKGNVSNTPKERIFLTFMRIQLSTGALFTLSIGIYGANLASCILAPLSSKSNRNNELANTDIRTDKKAAAWCNTEFFNL
jgi:hypothetical protein